MFELKIASELWEAFILIFATDCTYIVKEKTRGKLALVGIATYVGYNHYIFNGPHI